MLCGYYCSCLRVSPYVCSNFLVTKHTSALTLQVIGNAKGVVAAAVSVAVFKNAVTWQGCLVSDGVMVE